MVRFKTILIMLLTFCFAVMTGQQAPCDEEDTELFDMLPYWISLNEGNSWTYKMTYPGREEPLHYTKTVKGTEVVKGIEGVKWVLTDSNVPNGADSEGSYIVFLPDFSEGKTMIKWYFAKNFVFGRYYHLYVPFITSPRYVILDQGRWYQHIDSSSCFKEKPRKLLNFPIDSCIWIVNIQFLGFEDVTVPAGTFKECLKWRRQLKLNFAKKPVNNICIDLFYWEAESVGVVKYENAGMMFDAEFDFYPFNTILTEGGSELVSATIDGKNYP